MLERVRTRLVAEAYGLGLWIALTALVAMAAFYVMGFAQAAATHDVFHDLRHALGAPCH